MWKGKDEKLKDIFNKYDWEKWAEFRFKMDQLDFGETSLTIMNYLILYACLLYMIRTIMQTIFYG